MRIYAFSAYHFHRTTKAPANNRFGIPARHRPLTQPPHKTHLRTTVSASASAIARNHSFHTKPQTNIPFLFRTNHSIKKAPADVKASAGAILHSITPPGSSYRGSSVKPHS